MNKKSVFSSLLALLFSGSPAAAGEAVWRNVRDYGAVGDGKTLDTKAIQKAVDAGGTVYFPGGTYLTGTIELKSNGGLLLDENAVLLASTNPKDYERKLYDWENSGVGPGNQAHLIIAVGKENVFIKGGRIDGNGRAFFANETIRNNFTGGPMKTNPKFWLMQMVMFYDCKHIRINDTILDDSSCWSCFLHGCEYVTVDNVRVFTDPMIGQDDGIDIDGCRYVTVSNCIIDVGDDAITLRGNGNKFSPERPCEWITVTNCVLRSAYAHAIRVGVGNSIIRNAVFSNIAVRDSHCAVHINSKYSDAGSGCNISNLAFRNMQVDVEQLTYICHDYKSVKEVKSAKSIDNIVFDGISGNVRLPVVVRGNGVGNISDLTFSNMVLNVLGDMKNMERTKEFLMMKESDAVFHFYNVKDVDLFNVKLKYEIPQVWKHDVKSLNSTNINTEFCRFPKGVVSE
ncbi:MAG: hypothetical protein IKD10_01980 [Lentisphaeria bacterium]|nr:hypothetical protein [Lentisphaeria bacterium]